MSNPDRVLFLDIETTGLSHYYDEITVVGWSLGGRVETVVKGESPARLFSDAAAADALVTFNGIRFDTRFLRQELPSIQLPTIHIDLMYLCRRVGLKGGQKAIERELGLDLRTGLADLDGFAAVLLWHRYQRGDVEALQRLIRYNRADIAAMGALFDEALYRLAVVPDLLTLPTKFVEWSAPAGWDSMPHVGELAVATSAPKRFSETFGGTRAATARVVGIDLTGSEKRATGWCLLEGSNAVTRLISTDDDILSATVAARPDVVSIDSPLCLPHGRLSVSDDDPGRAEFGIMRWCERELKRRGVNVYPSLLPSMQKLTARGISLASQLRQRGIPVIESYPGAAQDIMRIPRKGAGEEWLKLGLGDFGIRGAFLRERVSHDELDAITSAVVGTFHLAGMSEELGTEREDPLIIPKIDVVGRPLVVGVSGPIAAGKTTFAKALEERGFAYTRFSLILDEVLSERRMELNRGNRQEMGQEFYRAGKQRQLGERALARVRHSKLIVVDGLRFPEDHALLSERFGLNFHHIHLHASVASRALRFQSRETGAFQEVEAAEVESRTQLMEALAHAVMDNDGAISDLAGKAEALVRDILGADECPSQS